MTRGDEKVFVTVCYSARTGKGHSRRNKWAGCNPWVFCRSSLCQWVGKGKGNCSVGFPVLCAMKWLLVKVSSIPTPLSFFVTGTHPNQPWTHTVAQVKLELGDILPTSCDYRSIYILIRLKKILETETDRYYLPVNGNSGIWFIYLECPWG